MEAVEANLTFERLRELTLAELITKTGVSIPLTEKALVNIIVLFPAKKKKLKLEEKMPAFRKLDFYGMWADRANMKDSVSWIRDLRETRSHRLYEN